MRPGTDETRDPTLDLPLAARALAAGLLVALPFALLVRGALVASARWGWHAGLAVAFGALLASFALSAIAWWTLRRLSMRPAFGDVAIRVSLPLVIAFCCFSLLYLSGSNAKSAAIRESYPSLHPVLRLAVGTVFTLSFFAFLGTGTFSFTIFDNTVPWLVRYSKTRLLYYQVFGLANVTTPWRM